MVYFVSALDNNIRYAGWIEPADAAKVVDMLMGVTVNAVRFTFYKTSAKTDPAAVTLLRSRIIYFEERTKVPD